MTTPPHKEVRIIRIVPQTWFGRLLATVGTIALIILVMLFFSVLFSVFLVLAIVVICWALWSNRQNRREASGNTIEAEYSVVRPEANQHDETKSVEDKRLNDCRNQERK